ncbi:MAG: class I SAM-dependent DNA methyltransferase, partial [Candidatus Methylomirabilis sp.]|nr:class I SAM-dependent DNA methyltransferase [Deltaproteobacteria bacterium]
FQSFLIELCEVLGVPPPDPPVPEVAENRYAFERPVTFRNPDGTTSPGAADLYRAGCFVMEAKQGSDPAAADPETPVFGEKVRRRRGTAVRGTPAWDDAMLRARGQAEQYAKALHDSGEPWPPFLVVVDVGHVFELYADFSRSGKTYLPFPDARSYRTGLKDAASAEFRALLHALWTDPLSLDPARRAARVTREVADRLAALAKSLEASERARTGATTREERAGIARAVAEFLMRALFTMFAEDVGLLPADGLTRLLEECRGRLQVLPARLKHLWMEMDKGGFSATLGADILRFNGGLFESSAALPLTEDQLGLLVDAARSDWSHVEPAIFGTLLERALDEEERHKLGAHYTPRAYVERLVLPTVIEPLRAEWTDVQAAAVALAKQGKLSDAQQLARDFHARLCRTTVLDPACGSGNFLYVTMEHMKRLEGEVLRSLEDLGMNEPFSVTGEREAVSVTVDPHQFLGIELNPRAATIAEMVLWIGYLQWHFRTRGKASPPEPVLRKFRNIECRDAVLAWDGEPEPARDADGKVLTRWDGKTTKRHPATGEEVPDET